MTDKTTHIVSVIIIAVLAGSTIWWMKHSYDHENPIEHYTEHIKDYPLLDPSLPFYDKDDLIVNVQELRSYLQSIPEANKDWADISIYFEVMNTGANISVNQDVKIRPASLLKLPIAMISMKKVEDGEWSFEDTKFELTGDDVDLSKDPTDVSKIGKSLKLRYLIDNLLLESDSSSYRVLTRNLTQDEFNEISEAVGLDLLLTSDDKLSAKDYTRLLRGLYNATYLDSANSQKLLDLLSNSEFNEFISAGLPSNTPFAHKWGGNLEYNIYSDSGIVYVKNRPYIISVMIQAKDDNVDLNRERATRLMKEIGENTYSFVSSQ